MIVSPVVNVELYDHQSFLTNGDPITSFTYTQGMPLPRVGENIYFDNCEYHVSLIEHVYHRGEGKYLTVAIALVVDKKVG